MTFEQEYMLKWIEINEKVKNENFTWSALEEDDDIHQYMSLDLYKMSSQQWDRVEEATRNIAYIVNKAYKIIFNDATLISRLGLPTQTWEAVKIYSEYFSYFTRFDLIINDDEIKLIEINCDTPTGYLETSVANRIICEDQGFVSPNNLEKSIEKAWSTIAANYGITESDIVHFTSYRDHEEDRETVLFNMANSNLNNVIYIPVEDIGVSEDGLFDQEGNKIDFLYRLYPLEYLVDDYDVTGKHIGQLFLDNIAAGRVKVINPPSSFLMQSKAVMAIIWSFYDKKRSDLFTTDELSLIKKHFIPTYFDDRRLENTCHVIKPIFGREGGGVQILDENKLILEKDSENWYSEWTKIFQEYVEMPEFTTNTWVGNYTGKLLFGSFLIGGEPSGLFLRVGEKITGNLSMFVGVTVYD